MRQSALREIVVVDDCSSDGSVEIARGLASSNDRLRIIENDTNSGPGAARNVGVRAASGNCVCFLDADDELLGDYFLDALGQFANRPTMRAVKPEEEFFDSLKGYILPDYDPRHKPAVLSAIHGLIVDRDTFLRMGGFPEDPVFRGPCGGEDMAFMQAVMAYLQPVGAILRPCYRAWTGASAPVDRFLRNTRLTSNGGFEFVRFHPDQEPGGVLAQAIDRYMEQVKQRLALPFNSPIASME
jgi:hypothetical protein